MKQRGPKSAASRATAPAYGIEAGAFAPPDTLSEAAREVFREVVSTTAPDHFEASDLALLEQYAEATALARRAAAKLQTGNPPAARWVSIWRDAVRAMKDLALRLRLSPQARREKAKAPRAPTFGETFRMKPYTRPASDGPIPGFEGADWTPPQ